MRSINRGSTRMSIFAVSVPAGEMGRGWAPGLITPAKRLIGGPRLFSAVASDSPWQWTGFLDSPFLVSGCYAARSGHAVSFLGRKGQFALFPALVRACTPDLP